MTTYKFHVDGMYCNACAVLAESELSEIAGVSVVKASFAQRSVEIAGDFGDRTAAQVAADLTPALAPHGYALTLEPPRHRVAWQEFVVAAPVAVGFLALFVVLQKAGVVSWVSASRIDYGTAFAIGVVASFSTCMAVVGGLVLSVSATFAKAGENMRPQMLFHAGRLVSFFVLGGAIGAAGSMFQIGPWTMLAIGLAIGLVMIVLGVGLLDVLPVAKRLQPTLPRVFARWVHRLKGVNHTLMPLAVGAATFVLPCGFTQSMQLYALSTGSFFSGSGIMLAFALGTLPVLAALSFGAAAVNGRRMSSVFFKTAGLVVVFFGVFNIWTSLAAVGVLPPPLSI